DTYKFISKAKKAGVKCLVHCKMGVSRSASTVIAYAMKEYSWDLERAFDHVKERRSVTKPNPSFMKQLEEIDLLTHIDLRISCNTFSLKRRSAESKSFH
uniref:Uncharacterized protein n=1 Tax=Cyprinus carpio TaxID=7962 RepID=A0A8C2FI36_CYPCA